ncbi:MAG: PepSY domain-containing protein [Methylococcaceae bacterium]
MKSVLFWLHRWVGVVLAAFMLVWFASGLVIMYSDTLNTSRPQQLAHAETLKPEPGWLSLGSAWAASATARKAATALEKSAPPAAAPMQTAKPASPEPDVIVDARLLRLAGQPYWLIENGPGKRYALSALDGSLHRITVEEALRIALHWLDGESSGKPAPVRYQETLETDSTLTNMESWKPFHRITVEDGTGSELLISARTGEVIRVSTAFERGLYYLGNWIHLLRFVDVFSPGDTRHSVQLWLGFGASLATATGLIVGWLRWRPGWFGKPTYSQGRTQPYRDFWWKWHFWGGLIGGVFAFFWGISGYLSTNPGQIFSNANPGRGELSAYYGKELPEIMRRWTPESLSEPDHGSRIVELNWRHLAQDAVLIAYTADAQRVRQPMEETVAEFDDTALAAAASRLTGLGEGVASSRLFRYDDYYYTRRSRSTWDRPLPVSQVDFADAAGSRLYLDPLDGRVLIKQDQSRRLYRWVYSLLHYWDFGWLQVRPLWDVWMLFGVSLGLVMSGASVVLGWNRLKWTFRTKKKKSLRTTNPAAEAPASATLIEPTGG